MKSSQPQLIPLRHLRVLPNNPRKITKQSLATLTDSIRTNGFYQHKPLAVERYLVARLDRQSLALGRELL